MTATPTIPVCVLPGLRWPLTRCPYCKGINLSLWGEKKSWKVGCGDCTASGPTKGNQFRAVMAWNIVAKRANSP